MITIKNAGSFQPSHDTLNKWLSTRKYGNMTDDLIVGGVPMPRYFSDVGDSTDRTWFMIAVLGELIGLVMTLWGGAKSGGSIFIFATMTIIMFIFCDFFFAYKLHRNKGEKCVLASRKLLVPDDDPAQIAALNFKENRGRFVDFLLGAGIIIIAITKVIGIALLGVFDEIILLVPFLILYSIVAYVHLQHTGYFFAYSATARALKKDYKSYAINQVNSAQTIRQSVATSAPLVGCPVIHFPHQIIVDRNNTSNNYTIEAKGVLTDQDIISLINGQSNVNRITLFKACRSLQLQNY